MTLICLSFNHELNLKMKSRTELVRDFDSQFKKQIHFSFRLFLRSVNLFSTSSFVLLEFGTKITPNEFFKFPKFSVSLTGKQNISQFPQCSTFTF